MKNMILLGISVVLFMGTVGCSQALHFTLDDVEKVSIEIIEERSTEDGISYTLKLMNQSKYTSTDVRIITRNNRLDIKPNEEVLLTAHVPKEIYEGNPLIHIDRPYAEIVGYFEEVENERRFTHYGPLERKSSIE